MSKIPDCDRCLLYTHQIYFVCAVHPEGVETAILILRFHDIKTPAPRGVNNS